MKEFLRETSPVEFCRSLVGKVISCWYVPPQETGPLDYIELFKCVVGFTVFPDDILLHLVDVETDDTSPIPILAEKTGVEFCFLKTLCGQTGFRIDPMLQLKSEDPN